jgi:hypothetical protein
VVAKPATTHLSIKEKIMSYFIITVTRKENGFDVTQYLEKGEWTEFDWSSSIKNALEFSTQSEARETLNLVLGQSREFDGRYPSSLIHSGLGLNRAKPTGKATFKILLCTDPVEVHAQEHADVIHFDV